MLLLNICNAWSDIALATPALWDSIHIVFRSLSPRTRGLKDLLPIWLERAYNCPSSRSLEWDLTTTSSTSFGDKYVEQLKHFEICEVDCESDECISEHTIQLWKGLPPSSRPLSSLETLVIRCMRNSWRFDPRHIFELLRLVPSPVDCVFFAEYRPISRFTSGKALSFPSSVAGGLENVEHVLIWITSLLRARRPLHPNPSPLSHGSC
jgi:hypothetical protein